MDDDGELLLALLIRICYSEPFRVANVDLESSDLPGPIEVVDNVVLHVEDPVIQPFRDEVEQYRLLLHLYQFHEGVFVCFEEGSCGVVERDVFSVQLPDLFVYGTMDLVSDTDRLANALEVDVQIGHEKFSKPEREQQLPALLHPVAVCDLERPERQGLVA